MDVYKGWEKGKVGTSLHKVVGNYHKTRGTDYT